MNKAKDDEWTFVLLGRDASRADIVAAALRVGKVVYLSTTVTTQRVSVAFMVNLATGR